MKCGSLERVKWEQRRFRQCLLVSLGSLAGSGKTAPENCFELRLQGKRHRTTLVVLESESNVGCLEFKNLFLPIFLWLSSATWPNFKKLACRRHSRRCVFRARKRKWPLSTKGRMEPGSVCLESSARWLLDALWVQMVYQDCSKTEQAWVPRSGVRA